LKDGGLDAYACGNIGAPLIEFCQLEEESIAVAEISSFQLETLNSLCPHVSVVLNITEDHLNRHYNMENLFCKGDFNISKIYGGEVKNGKSKKN
jgi:UDP-N-acetylmuramoylalanine--D-glutamate ligase